MSPFLFQPIQTGQQIIGCAAGNATRGKTIHGAARRYALITWVAQNAVDPVTQIERVESTYIYDSNGRQYLDFSSQLININLGHGESIDWIKRRVLELGLEVRVSDHFIHFIIISSQLSITAE